MAADSELDLEVFFCHHAGPDEQARAGFGVKFDWDIPLLEGYRSRFLKNVARNPSIGNFFGMNTPEIAEVLAKGHYDAFIVFGWNYQSAWQAITTCWRLKIPIMVRGDSHLHTPRHLVKKILKQPLYRQLIPRFSACLAVGRRSREYFLYYGARPDQVFFVPHAVDSPRFEQEVLRLGARRSEFRKRWALEDTAPVFLFVGKFIKKKRPHDFILGIEQAAKRVKGITGLMVGDGVLRPSCEALVRERNLPIRFAGFLNQSEIVQSYLAADFLVIPSDGGETWGLVVNEAMTCGMPAIVSDAVGCSVDLIEEGRTGFVYPLGDINQLGEAMERMIPNARNPAIITALKKKMDVYSFKTATKGIKKALNIKK